MAIYGYAHVSTIDQDLSLQRRMLKAAGYDVMRAEKASGTRRNGRTELQVLLDFLRPGDTLVVTQVDGLARSIRDLQNLVRELRERGASRSRQPSSPSILALRPARRSFDMLGVSLSSRPISVASVNSKASRRPRPEVSTRAASARSMTRVSVDCTRRAWDRPRSRASSESVAHPSIARAVQWLRVALAIAILRSKAPVTVPTRKGLRGAFIVEQFTQHCAAV